MAANVETMAIVVALTDPPPSLPMLDRLIAFAVQHEVEAALILTKADLAGSAAAERIASVYAPLDVPVLVVQPEDGRRHRRTRRPISRAGMRCWSGNSGVGKSSIFRALGGTATVGDLSRFGRGRQTTTSARLFQTPNGFLVDSPGIGEFILDPMPPDELARALRRNARTRDALPLRRLPPSPGAGLRGPGGRRRGAHRRQPLRELPRAGRRCRPSIGAGFLIY